MQNSSPDLKGQNQVITLPNTLKNREYSGGHFKLRDKGVTFNGTDKDGNQLLPSFVAK